ncbi:MAG: hypothetical protein Q9202_002146 [Teloschistes flavicans]
MSSGLLFGFSKNLPMAIVARSLAGASNGNVGILRTSVAEMVPQKELQPRAFSPTSSSVQETLETKKHRRDYGRVIGKAIIRSFRKKPKKHRMLIDAEQSASLLNRSPTSSVSAVKDRDGIKSSKQPPRSLTSTDLKVFSRQSKINLLTYTLLALHSVAYDQLLPIFMHHPPQANRSSNPEVRLPFKFSGGFGIDSSQIGFLFTLYGVAGTMIQFLIFPPVARYYGILNCYKIVALMFPLIYLATPFTALLPTPLTQQIGMFLIMLVKCFAAIFAFPCITILLTNSAVSLRILGTLNGVATSVSALGRAIGPALGGAMFEVGADQGWAILPWWVLAGFAVVGAIPVWWIVEMDGFGGSGDNSDDEADQDEQPEVPQAEETRRAEPHTVESPESIPVPNEQDIDFDAEDSDSISGNQLSKTMSRSSGAEIAAPYRRV